MKKFLLLGVPLLALGGVACFILGKRYIYQKFDEKMGQLTITQTIVDEDSIRLKLKTGFEENDIPSFLDSIQYTTELMGDTVSEGMKRLDTLSGDTRKLLFPIAVNSELVKELVKNNQGDSAEVVMHTRNYMSFPLFGKKQIDLEKQFTIKLPVRPEVRIRKVKVDDFGIDSLDMTAIISIDNPNNMDFTIKHMKFNMTLGEYGNSSGSTDKNFHIKKKGVSTVELPIHTDLKHQIKAGWKTLRNKDKVKYHLHSEMILDPSDSKIEDISMKSEKKGVMDLSEALKKSKNKERVGVSENK